VKRKGQGERKSDFTAKGLPGGDQRREGVSKIRGGRVRIVCAGPRGRERGIDTRQRLQGSNQS